MPRTKSNIHNCNSKHLKTATQCNKNKEPLEPSLNAGVKCVNKRKHFTKNDKMKPLDMKRKNKEETRNIWLDPIGDSIKRSVTLKTFPHTKCDTTLVHMMKKYATTSSSSPCPSSPEASIPKNISHGH